MADIITCDDLRLMRADHVRKIQEKQNIHVHSQVCQFTRAIIEENNHGKNVYIKYLYNEDPEVVSLIVQKLQEKFIDSMITVNNDTIYQKNTIITVIWH
jgi:hypothetical protein